MPTFEKRMAWLPWGAGVVVGSFFYVLLWPFPTAQLAVLFLVGIALVGGVIAVVRSFAAYGKYDLNKLREEVEQDETRRRLQEELPANPDRVLCLCCGEEYESKLLVCPNCHERR